MINKNRVVPVQKTDLLTLIGTMLTLAGTSYTVLEAIDVRGTFEVSGDGAAGNKLANQPLSSLDFKAGITSGVIYFIPSYDYEGIKVAGASATITDQSAVVNPDGVTLYKAELSDGSVTITSISPQAE